MNSTKRLILLAPPLACLLLASCQQKMSVQPSVRPDEVSDFFPDGNGNRPVVPGTIARGHLRTDLHYFTGKRTEESVAEPVAISVLGQGFGANLLGTTALAVLDNGQYVEDLTYVDEFPFPVTRDVLDQGRDRFMIYCVVCHDSLGTGHGKIVERGYTQPPSYHVERLRRAPVGRFFDVMTNGYGSMPDYTQQIEPRDRWAIAAYIRALQLSQHFPRDQLSKELQAEFDKTTDSEGSP
jgi:mono/diheme cytochrome c family protein